MIYDFETQRAKGNAGERFLDDYFAGGYDIRPATLQEQRQGIDRVFTNRQTGQVTRIEYKTDYAAARTHNAFVETTSVDTMGKRGWAYTSKADYVLYYIPGDGLIYVMALKILRRQLSRWCKVYPRRRAKNHGYATHGIVVPLAEFESHAEKTISV